MADRLYRIDLGRPKNLLGENNLVSGAVNRPVNRALFKGIQPDTKHRNRLIPKHHFGVLAPGVFGRVYNHPALEGLFARCRDETINVLLANPAGKVVKFALDSGETIFGFELGNEVNPCVAPIPAMRVCPVGIGGHLLIFPGFGGIAGQKALAQILKISPLRALGMGGLPIRVQKLAKGGMSHFASLRLVRDSLSPHPNGSLALIFIYFV